MGGNGVSDISAGAGEGVGGVVNVSDLTSGLIARLGASGPEMAIFDTDINVQKGGGIDNELAKGSGFSEGDRQRFGKKVLG